MVDLDPATDATDHSDTRTPARIDAIWLLLLVLALVGCDEGRGVFDETASADTTSGTQPAPHTPNDARAVENERTAPLVAPGPVANFDSILERVPASTAFIWASTEPPEDPGDGDDAARAVALDDWSPFFDTVANAISGELESDDDLQELLRATLDELRGRYTATGLTELGLAEQPRYVLYLVGMAPSARLEIDAPAAIDRALTRIEERADLVAERRRLGDVPYRAWELSDWTLVAAVFPNELVIALIPSGAIDDALPVLLGKPPADPSLASKGGLDSIIALADTDRPVSAAGWVDLDALRSQPMMQSAEAARSLLELVDIPASLGGACVEDLARLSAIVRRVGLVAGDDPHAQWGSVVVELADPALLEPLLEMKVPIPGLGKRTWSREALGSAAGPAVDDIPAAFAGIGLDLGDLGELLTRLRDAVSERPFGCTALFNMNELVSTAHATWMALPAPLRQARGAYALSTRTQIARRGGISETEGIFVIGSRDPRDLWESMAEGTSMPQRLRRSDVTRVGTADEWPMFSSLTARPLDDALVMTSGEGVGDHLDLLLTLTKAQDTDGERQGDAQDPADGSEDTPPEDAAPTRAARSDLVDDPTLVAELGYDYGRLMSSWFEAAPPDVERVAAKRTNDAAMKLGLFVVSLHIDDGGILRLRYALEAR